MRFSPPVRLETGLAGGVAGKVAAFAHACAPFGASPHIVACIEHPQDIEVISLVSDYRNSFSVIVTSDGRDG